jgi:hypothetical protein
MESKKEFEILLKIIEQDSCYKISTKKIDIKIEKSFIRLIFK